MNFEEANKKVHLVEEQWHYPILSAHGFLPETKEGIGFVRSYDYSHPDGRRIRCTTGYSADHWESLDGTKGRGYWSDLEGFIKR